MTNNGGGDVTYRPNSGLAGADSFTYAIADGRGGAATATVHVTIVPKTLHVTDLDGSSVSTSGRRWRATVQISVVDAAGAGVSGGAGAGAGGPGATGSGPAG